MKRTHAVNRGLFRRFRLPAALTVASLLVVTAGLAACVPGPCGSSPCAPGPPSQVGIFIPLFTGVTDANDVVAEANALGVHTARASQDVTASGVRPAFATFAAKGLKTVLTALNHPVPDGTGHNPVAPPVTPEELATYRTQLGAKLDAVAAPSVVQVENEENAAEFFSGTMTQYRAELDAAIEVAHARGVTVTDGAITSNPLAMLVWKDYKDRGLDVEADNFAARAFKDPADAWILRDLRKVPFTGLSRQNLQIAWDKATELVPLLATSNVDFVNFHWYIDDDQALKEAVDYLRRATAKPVVTTEIGQYNTTPSVVTGHLGKMVEALHLPLVIWFDFDGQPALGLHDTATPGVPRPNGAAFKDYVTKHADTIR